MERTTTWLALACGAGITLASQHVEAQAYPVCTKASLQDFMNARAAQDPANSDLYANIKDVQSVSGQCVVQGTIRSRPNIVFQLRLPPRSAWNHKFFFEGGAGLDGYLPSAKGNKLGGSGSASDDNFAVAATNAGHFFLERCTAPLDDAEALLACAGQAVSAVFSRPFALYAQFGLDEQQRIDYGYRAIELVTRATKKLVGHYYAGVSAIERSYFVGCSNGGRQAVMAAKRLPEEYDGILAGAPAINLTKQAFQGAVDAQAIASQNLGDKPWEAFSEADMEFVGRKILDACDKLDGALDGMVGDPVACQHKFDPNILYLYVRSFNWWSKVDALKGMMAGVRVQGEQQYGGWMWDPGVAAKAHEVASFRSWRLESVIGKADLWTPAPYPIATVIGGGALGYVLPSPPVSWASGPKSGAEMWNFLKTTNIAAGLTNTYVGSSASYFPTHYHYDVPSPHVLDGLANRKGKLIVFSGSADGAVATNDLIDWYEALQDEDSANGRNTDDYARLYVVPGMAHCGAGPATDHFNLFTKLESWVDYQRCLDDSTCTAARRQALKAAFEQRTIATVGANNKDAPEAWRGVRTRPLCPYPQVAKFIPGSSGFDSANNYQCQ